VQGPVPALWALWLSRLQAAQQQVPLPLLLPSSFIDQATESDLRIDDGMQTSR